MALAPAPLNTTLMCVDLLAGDFQGIEQAGAGDDGGAVLVVVEDRDLHGLPQLSSM